MEIHQFVHDSYCFHPETNMQIDSLLLRLQFLVVCDVQ